MAEVALAAALVVAVVSGGGGGGGGCRCWYPHSPGQHCLFFSTLLMQLKMLVRWDSK